MDIAKRLIVLRHQEKWSQEELALKLHVSRQTVTKWESGSIPALDLLIQISDLYGIPLDDLVREPCNAMQDIKVSAHDLVSFLLEAKKNTYAVRKNKTVSSRLHSVDYAYEKDDYRYLDSFVGSSRFSGQEIVWHQSIPVWSMNYYGRVLADHFSSDFLNEALLSGTKVYPYRGSASYQKGSYTYVMMTDGSIDNFHGKEDIYYLEELCYTCYFHGGSIK